MQIKLRIFDEMQQLDLQITRMPQVTSRNFIINLNGSLFIFRRKVEFNAWIFLLGHL